MLTERKSAGGMIWAYGLLLLGCSTASKLPPKDAGIDVLGNHDMDGSIDAPEQVTGLSAARRSGENAWAVSWSETPSASSYEIQQSHDQDFNGAVTDQLDASPLEVSETPSPNNAFYYRVRGLKNGIVGPWSEPLRVISGYRETFDAGKGDWQIRRTTYIEKVNTWAEQSEGKGWLVLQVADRWDWGIASPLVPMPIPPYAIEFRAQVAEETWAASYGVVFAGDWNGQLCPDPSADVHSDAGRYQHTRCFNHFYALNVIFNDDLDLLFERVDELNWCPSCGGSPMKRLGDFVLTGDVVPQGTGDGQGLGWNTWRIVVREEGIDVFVNDVLKYHYSDARWITQRYFGVFATTDEYNNSTARFDYIEVLPLYEETS
ncbi:MAG: hypothetical protein H6714_06655 [Myxococcales bacterium]|nr:hypothetical protein [Myxococcales bacterium]